MTDAALLESFRTGNDMDEAIRTLYRLYFDSLSGYVIHNNGSMQDAEDVFQEVLVSFIDIVKKGRFRGESSVKTFLFSLNRFTWLNELKKRGRSLKREEKYSLAEGNTEMDVSEFIAERETKDQLMKAVAKLGDICQKILVMFYFENMSMREMLGVLNYENEQVIRNKKSKCLKELSTIITANPNMAAQLKILLHE